MTFWLNVEKFLPTIGSVVLNALCTPHANAFVERLFSTVKNIKNDKRNRINPKTLDGTLKARDSARSNSIDWVYQPTEEQIVAVLDRKYYLQKKKKKKKEKPIGS